MGLLDKVQDKLGNKGHHNNNPNHPNTGTYDNTHTGTHGQGMVPGSQANNPNAIPTAGGQSVGGTGYNDPSVNTNTGYNSNVGGTGYNSNVGGPGGNTGYGNAGLHETTGDKIQNALPGQHGNAHDAHGNSVDMSGPGRNNAGFNNNNPNTGFNNNNPNTGFNNNNPNSSFNNNNPNSGFNNNNPNTGFNNNNAGLHETTGDRIQNALPGQHGNAHDAHGNSVDLSGPGRNYGTTTGGIAGSHNTHSTHNTHNTHTGPDNRGMMDKAKDALSSKRTNQPDDPVTGTNYDQNNRNTHGGVTGSNDPYHQTGSGLHGNTHNTHNNHNTHNTHSSHNTHGNDNRGLMDKAKDVLSSKRSNQPDDPVTGTNYDQKNTGGIHGNTYNQQPGVGNTGAYNAPGSGPGYNAPGGPGVGNTGYNAPGSGPAPNY
jgi:hypothetical protein